MTATYAEDLLTNRDLRRAAESGGSQAIAFSQPRSATPVWLEAVNRAIDRVIQLERNWDGYGAVQVDRNSVRRVSWVLEEIMEHDSPAPAIVPLSDGGVQVEWHRRGRHLEIEFVSGAPPRFYCYEDDGAAEREGLVAPNLSMLRREVALLR